MMNDFYVARDLFNNYRNPFLHFKDICTCCILLNNISAMEVILNPGDAIFIPIGWWHRVESLDVSISLSFINFDLPNQFSNSYPSGTGKQKALSGRQSV